MSKLISVGKILNFHGIKGEVKMGFTAGRETVLKNLKQVFVFTDNVKKQLDVESVRFHKNTAIIKFKQLNSINDVMSVKGLLVHVNEDILKAGLQKDEFLINDLIGLKVYDTEGIEIGKVSDVGENKASNLLEIQKNNGLKFMVPFVKEWVPHVYIADNKIVVNLIDGIEPNSKSAENDNEV